jgi:transcriptional regulator with XRE-family HTH domain
MTFPVELQAQLDRLSAAGWSREQIAAATGYTRQRLSAWARGPVEPPHALRVGLLAVLRGLRGKPPDSSDAQRIAKPDAQHPRQSTSFTA